MTSEQDVQWGLTVNSVGFQHIAQGEDYPPQGHPTRYLFKTDKGRILDEYQLLYITRGKGRFCSAQTQKCAVSEGNMFLLFPGEWHSYKPDSGIGWDEYWIGFNGKNMDLKVQSAFFDKEQPILDVGIQNNLVSMYLQAIEVAQKQSSGFQQMLAGIVDYLLGYAYTTHRTSSFEEMKVIKQINRSKLMMLENISENLSPQLIAQNLNVSYSWFRKMFKQYTGFSPMQYIIEMRIQKSKELLTNTELSNIEISYKLGFDNPNYFCTTFKKKTNLTPMKYRLMTQGKYKEQNADQNI